MKATLIILAILVLVACAKVPISGRRQLNLLPERELMSMSLTNYNDFLAQNQRLENNQARMVKEVGNKIAAAATKYLKQHGHGKRIEGFQWEFNLVDDPAVNAWCMPGGKVVFYTGILPYTQNDTGLAVVMGHEIAHAVARHGNERMSQGLALQMGGLTLQAALSQKSETTQNIFMQSFGVASNLGMLKYSRSHESEADQMGLVFMALAGYDPTEAIEFWTRMSKSGGQKPPELLSTHPHDDTRIEEIKAFLPQAKKYLKK